MWLIIMIIYCCYNISRWIKIIIPVPRRSQRTFWSLCPKINILIFYYLLIQWSLTRCLKPGNLTIFGWWFVIAKFHYTDPTRTGPDTDKVRARCRVRAKFHYTDQTRTRPDPHGPALTFFAAKLRWVRAGPVGSVWWNLAFTRRLMVTFRF